MTINEFVQKAYSIRIQNWSSREKKNKNFKNLVKQIRSIFRGLIESASINPQGNDIVEY